jgi:DNA-binding NarL/FixJ family response regulator
MTDGSDLMASSVDILVVSRLATVRAGLGALLAAAGGVRVVGQADALDGVAAADLLPDVEVVLADASSGEELDEIVAALERLGPGLVVLGPSGAVSRVTLAAPSFAWAYLAREAGPERIVAAVRAVAAGLVAVDPELATSALGDRAAGPLPPAGEMDELTLREREVLTLVAIGLTNKAIAQRLSISDHTVKFHVASILAKLDAESRTEAVHVAARRGLLTL